MSRMLVRPPARAFVIDPASMPHGVTGLVNYGAVNTDRAPGMVRGSSTTLYPFETHWDDIQQINPAHEQPKLILYSAAQPLIRWGHRRFVRTFMSAGPRFEGRWAFVGAIQRAYTERGRMTGMPGRSSFARQTYVYPRFTTAPRAIVLDARRRPSSADLGV